LPASIETSLPSAVFCARSRIGAQHRDLDAVDRRAASEVLAGVRLEIDPQVLQKRIRVHGSLLTYR
jgi:hypothetical protein